MQGMDYARVKALFRYDAELGGLRWRERRRGVRADGEAGSTVNGCRRVTVDGKTYSVGQLVWLLRTGHKAKGGVRYLDGNRLNTRFENLAPGRPDSFVLTPKGRGFTLDYQGARTHCATAQEALDMLALLL